jgi:regulator of sigma E protease
LGGFVKIYGESAAAGNLERPERSFANQSAWRRAVVVAAGVAVNFIFGWLILAIVFFVGSPSLIMIDVVAPNSPAALAGFQPGDRVLGYGMAGNLVDFINSHRGEEIVLEIQRGEEILTLAAVPRVTAAAGEGALGIGIRDSGIPKHGFFESIGRGLLTAAALVVAIFGGLYQVIFMPSSIVGPVGIFDIAIDTGRLGLIHLFQFIALISLNLVVLNILPIPALDGGRLLFIILEKVRGRRFLAQTEAMANAIGFTFLILLIISITIKDIAGLF